jgi:hypothetical protein
MALLLPHGASRRSVSDLTSSGREHSKAKIVFAGVFASGLALAVNCVGPRGGIAQLTVIGDENGGSIPQSLGSRATQSTAYQLITAHCSKFGKKSFITQMDFEGGTITFVCILQKPAPGS